MWCNGIGWFANAWSSRRFLPLRLSPVRFTRGTLLPLLLTCGLPQPLLVHVYQPQRPRHPLPHRYLPLTRRAQAPPPRFTSPARCMLGTARGVSTCPARGCCVVSLAITTGELLPARDVACGDGSDGARSDDPDSGLQYHLSPPSPRRLRW